VAAGGTGVVWMTAVGDLIAGCYRVERPLVAGNLGRIWLGTDQRTGRTVALKKCALPEGLTPQQHSVLRVWAPREARAFARIRHPHVIRTFDVLLDGDAPWIVMEYVPSRSLLDVLLDEGPLPPGRVAGIGLDLLAALAAAREADVLHLDVKPSNVLIAEDGRVVLTDFGPAGTAAGVAALAEAEIVVGSPGYLAPERLFDGVSDERSDLWSLGATLYHAVEGRTPFQGVGTEDALRAADDGRPDPPVRAGPLAPVLLGLLRREPAERMPAAEVRARLRRIAPAARRADALGARVAAVAAVAVIAAGGIAFVNERSGAVPDASTAAPSVALSPAAAPSIALPPGYIWLTGPGGEFRVAVPRRWRPVRSTGGLVCTAPGGQPVLGVAPWTTQGDLVATLTAAERRTRLLGYRRVRIGTVTTPPGAMWEYTFQDPRAGAMRALRQIVTVGGRSYEVNWRTSAADWATDLPTLLTALPTVGPAPGD
jgi:hypothetical protein